MVLRHLTTKAHKPRLQLNKLQQPWFPFTPRLQLRPTHTQYLGLSFRIPRAIFGQIPFVSEFHHQPE